MFGWSVMIKNMGSIQMAHGFIPTAATNIKKE
jgi:hypothetical protein